MDALKTLKECFGYSSFRNGQKKTVQAILSGKDVIAIMPTGAGKSMCGKSRYGQSSSFCRIFSSSHTSPSRAFSSAISSS